MKQVTFFNLNNFIEKVSAIGSIYIYLLIVLFLYSLSITQIANILLLALIILYIMSVPIRAIFFRERPIPDKYSNYIEKLKAGSFPSLHSARATIMFLTFSFMFIYEIYTILLLTIVYILILISRIRKKRHYISDVTGGVIIGLIAFLIAEVLVDLIV